VAAFGGERQSDQECRNGDNAEASDQAPAVPLARETGPAEWEGLRLAAKAADRAKVADQLPSDFENRLTALGYTPLGIAHAFSLLSRPGTIAEALEALDRYRA
jgi:hypothetical protein